MLNNVTFETVGGGLGRLPQGKDHVSAIAKDFTPPVAWNGAIGKRYLSLEQAELDGITESTHAVLHYAVSEFFRMSGPSELYIICSSHTNFDANHIKDLTNGDLRQMYMDEDVDFAGLPTKIAEIKAIAVELEEAFCPCQFIVSVHETAPVTTSLPDLKTLDAENVSVLIGGDGSGKGAEIAEGLGFQYLPAGGTLLGAISSAKVHENIGWVREFPLATITDFQSAVLSDGTSERAASPSLLADLNNKGYIFCRSHQGVNGTYFNDSHTAALATSDLYSIENNRTLHKAKRNIRAALLPDLNSPITVDAEGKVSASTALYFERLTARPLDRMQNAGELSGFSVTIDPEQNVLATSKLTIQVKLQFRGVARDIVVNIGFAVNITN